MKHLFLVRNLILTAFMLTGAITVPAQRLQNLERPIPTPVEHSIAGLASGGSIPIFADGNPVPVGATFTGAGRALDLGQFVAVGELRFEPTDDPYVSHETGRAVFTADNGDQLRILIDGLTDQRTLLTLGTLEFAGGTGRYTNARGKADIVVLHNFVTGFFEVTVIGKVIY